MDTTMDHCPHPPFFVLRMITFCFFFSQHVALSSGHPTIKCAGTCPPFFISRCEEQINLLYGSVSIRSSLRKSISFRVIFLTKFGSFRETRIFLQYILSTLMLDRTFIFLNIIISISYNACFLSLHEHMTTTRGFRFLFLLSSINFRLSWIFGHTILIYLCHPLLFILLKIPMLRVQMHVLRQQTILGSQMISTKCSV